VAELAVQRQRDRGGADGLQEGTAVQPGAGRATLRRFPAGFLILNFLVLHTSSRFGTRCEPTCAAQWVAEFGL
jgi:hypothetical protein